MEKDLLNSLFVNVIYAEMDYQDGKINIDTLSYTYHLTYRLVLVHINDTGLLEDWYSNPIIANVKSILAEAEAESLTGE